MYLQKVNELNGFSLNVFQYWTSKSTNYSARFVLALKVFCVPASSAPVECIFSQSGLVTQPHRASIIVHFKCNSNMQKQKQSLFR